jgi:hypothetical protein
MRTMQGLHGLTFAAVVVVIASSAPSAFAFGGTAGELGQAGNFVISNRANLGFTQPLYNNPTTTILLAPELDYFVANNFSIGGAIVLDITTPHGETSFGVVPQAGYNVVLSNTWSWWPRLAVTLLTGVPATISVELSAPFLIHPAEHFFFGFGPAVETNLNDHNLPTTIFGEFIVGGYFSS